jgi:bacterioferritin-associated ferredoxin
MAEQGVCASRCGVEHHAHPIPVTFYDRKAA